MAGRFMTLDQFLNIILTWHKPEVPQNAARNPIPRCVMAHYLNLIAVGLVPAVIGAAGLLLGMAWYELTHQRR
jgi:hypothetical protein